MYGGTLPTEFDPNMVVQNKEGLILHPLNGHKYLKYGAFDTNISM
jgi:hypothetical protein